MAPPNPVLYETGTTTALAGHSWGTVSSPGTSGEWLFDIANSGATADPVNDGAIGMLESYDGGTTWIEGPASLGGWVEAQLYDVAVDTGGNSISAQTTSWTPIGFGKRLRVNQIPGGTRRKAKARLNLPSQGVSSTGVLFKIIFYSGSNAIALVVGLYEGAMHGVYSGAGDPTFYELLAGGTPAQSGTPDNYLQITDTTVVRAAGSIRVKYAHQLSIAASASGNARWVVVYWDGLTGSFSTVSSTEVTAPAPISQRPAIPANSVLIVDIHRDDGAINTADLYTDRRALGCFGLTTTGLNYTLGRGTALVQNRLVQIENPAGASLPDNATTIIGLTPGGGRVTGTSLTDQSEPLWAVTTASGAETARRDLRNMLVNRNYVFAEFHYDAEPALNDYRYWTAPFETGVDLSFPEMFQLSVGDMGDRSAGTVEIDVQYWDGAAWTSLFSDSTKRPKLAYNATSLVANSFVADTTVLGGKTRFRAKLTDKPTGGTVGPTGVTLRMLLERTPF